ncbi:AGE family epimerase/isomerase [Apibacter raozihei]|uniref:AGE family epimerase/isomerase n=1 Tax=Apibacter raozihei TaxID=2500547 RepID=UPI000FE3C37E|nr:AGE family epimerase/isomerase [Apibacter raozihei]
MKNYKEHDIESSWVKSKDHQQYLHQQGNELLKFGLNSVLKQGGFGYLDDNGNLINKALDTMENARMTHCYSLASMKFPEYGKIADHGVKVLLDVINDKEHDGWFYSIGGLGDAGRKQAYIHAFIALAGSSAKISGRKDGELLLEKAIHILEKYFWSEEEGAMLESYDYDWSDLESYRGANSNMHSTEAFLAVFSATQDVKWLQRALKIVERIIHVHAKKNHYSVIEHFTPQWEEIKDYNKEDKNNQFRPYGITPGHGFEWSRLLVGLEAELYKNEMEVPEWLLEDAEKLFEKAWKESWDVDGKPGIVYTVDFDEKPIVRDRLHWTLAEASAAAVSFLRRTGNVAYDDKYKLLWEYIDKYLVDHQKGSWFHNLDENNKPTERIWLGKPDIYHALQATIIPNLPLGGSITEGVKNNVSKVL